MKEIKPKTVFTTLFFLLSPPITLPPSISPKMNGNCLNVTCLYTRGWLKPGKMKSKEVTKKSVKIFLIIFPLFLKMKLIFLYKIGFGDFQPSGIMWLLFR
eukprot:Lithocolla_globosa_v1_NODE_1010_length_2958_cov_12.883913.p2 type:complete len:100 gc:universal NODE_1010_length_2958_cov_12.883913:432-731(+)